MKRLYLTLAFLLITPALFAQFNLPGMDVLTKTDKSFSTFNNCGTPTAGDLVVNGGFEQYSSLPVFSGQIANACNWSVANLTTPDYYHRHSTNQTISVPENGKGTQEVNPVHGGDAYAGIWVAAELRANGELSTYIETVKNQLHEPLRPNTEYTLTFDVSLSDNHTDAIRFQAFLGNLFSSSFRDELPVDEQPNGILLENESPSTNTTGWETIEFTFTTGAEAGQDYLYLGGLYEIDYTALTGGNNSHLSYYYIDNVSLTEIDNCTDCTHGLRDELQHRLWEGFTEDLEKCGNYSFVIPELEECHEIEIDWGDGNIDVFNREHSESTINHMYTVNGTQRIVTTILVDGAPCGNEEIKEIIVDCCEDCERTGDTMVKSFEPASVCGEYRIAIPDEVFECYRVALYTGESGISYTITQDDVQGGFFTYGYSENGTYTATLLLYELNSRSQCYELDFEVNVDCPVSSECQEDPEQVALLENHLVSILNGILNLRDDYTGRCASGAPSTRVDITNMPEVDWSTREKVS